MKSQEKELIAARTIISQDALLEHWQGHRQLTRKVIEVFPEDKFFTYSIGGMRSFSELVIEMISIAGPGIAGMATGEWKEFKDLQIPNTKTEVLKLWDDVTEQINRLWPQIPPSRFHEEEIAFEVYEGQIYSHLFYFIDNEIHHRGQGYVYLRSLDIEPPHFGKLEKKLLT